MVLITTEVIFVPRVARIKSKSGIYHVIMRGINRDFCKLISLEIMAFSESKTKGEVTYEYSARIRIFLRMQTLMY